MCSSASTTGEAQTRRGGPARPQRRAPAQAPRGLRGGGGVPLGRLYARPGASAARPGRPARAPLGAHEARRYRAAAAPRAQEVRQPGPVFSVLIPPPLRSLRSRCPPLWRAK